MPFGANWLVEAYSAKDMAWHPSAHASATTSKYGVFRFTMSYQRDVLLCIRGAAFRINGQVAKYLLMKREGRNVVKYDPSSRTFFAPRICRPPLLIERALVLCSGLPPSIRLEDGIAEVLYTNVSAPVAQLATQLLGQEIEWKIRS
jgi:hypothetical protein